MIAILLTIAVSLATIYLLAGLFTVAAFQRHWQAHSWGEATLQFIIWPWLAFIIVVEWIEERPF